MVAIVTSTLQPAAGKSYFDFNDRLSQTKLTLRRLQKFNFQKIILIDNSDTLDQTQLNTLLIEFPLVDKHHTRQYQFGFKGLTEALLLLNNLHNIPANTPLFKISGRYYPNESFEVCDENLFDKYDFIGVGTAFNAKTPFFSTRGYFVKDKQVLEDMLNLAIEEIIGYGNRIYGPKSFMMSISNLLNATIGVPYYIALEQAFGRILKYKRNYLLLNTVNIEGYVAGSDYLDLVKE